MINQYLSDRTRHAAAAVWDSLVIPHLGDACRDTSAETMRRAGCYIQGMSLVADTDSDEQIFLHWLSDAADEIAMDKEILDFSPFGDAASPSTS